MRREAVESLCSLSSGTSTHSLNQKAVVSVTNTRKTSTRLQKSKRIGRGAFTSSGSGDILANLTSLTNNRIKSNVSAKHGYKTSSNTLSKISMESHYFRKGKRLFSPEKKISVSVLETLSQQQLLDSLNHLADNALSLPIQTDVRKPFKRMDQKKTPMKYPNSKIKSKARSEPSNKVVQKEESYQYFPKIVDIPVQYDIDCNTECSQPLTPSFQENTEMKTEAVKSGYLKNHGDMIATNSPDFNTCKTIQVSDDDLDKQNILNITHLQSSPSEGNYTCNVFVDETFLDLNKSMSKMALDGNYVSAKNDSVISSSSLLSSSGLVIGHNPALCAIALSTENVTMSKTTKQSSIETTCLRRSSRTRQPVNRYGYETNHHDDSEQHQFQQSCKELSCTQYSDESDDSVISHTTITMSVNELNSFKQVDDVTTHSSDHTIVCSDSNTQHNHQPEVRRSSRARKPVSRLSISFRRRRRPKLFYVCNTSVSAKDDSEACAENEESSIIFSDEYRYVDAMTDMNKSPNNEITRPVDTIISNIPSTVNPSRDDSVIRMEETKLKPENGSLHPLTETTELSTTLFRRSQRTRKITQRLVVTFNRPQPHNSPYDMNSDADSQDDQVRTVNARSKQKINELNVEKNTTAAGQENHNLLGWTDDDIQMLKLSYRSVDPLSTHFWSDAASKIPGKTAEDCRSMWFSMIQTPGNKRLASANKKSLLRKAVDTDNDHSVSCNDDIFDSTPLRVLFHVNTEKKILPHSDSNRRSSGRVRFSIEFASPIVRSDDEVNNSFRDVNCSYESDGSKCADNHYDIYNRSPIICRANSKGYLQKLKTGWKDDTTNLQTTKKKPRKKKMTLLNMDDAMTRDVMESVEVGDVHMNGVLSPGGTLHIQAPDELELEELFLPSDEEI